MAEQTITTAAVGRTSAPPDEVGLRFAVRAVDPDVTGARRGVAERATQLRRVLDDVGVPGDQIRTSGFHIRQRPPERDRPPGGGSEGDVDADARPYRATEKISVTLLDLDSLSDVLAAAVDDAGVEIDEVVFTFRTETRRELEREALADAVATARAKANAAAGAEDRGVGKVQSITTEDVTRPHRKGAGQQLAGAATESGTVESGPMEVQIRTRVEYRLTEP